MSGGLRLDHWDGPPIGPGSTLGFTLASADVFGPEALTPGQGFTLNVAGEIWRALLAKAAVSLDGHAVAIEVVVEGRYPEPSP